LAALTKKRYLVQEEIIMLQKAGVNFEIKEKEHVAM
jgi:hypothetical protein